MITVLDFGEKIAGAMRRRSRNLKVSEAYLGAEQQRISQKSRGALNRSDKMAMLEVENIHSYYGNIHALKGVSLTVDKGEIVTLIGGNGAGKTTTLRTITGIMKPREGKVSLEGENLDRYKAHQLALKA
jgi:ABC-type branched-subunit amino acid transport system ATPase component